jgi:hypothetical protein
MWSSKPPYGVGRLPRNSVLEEVEKTKEEYEKKL